MIKHTENPGHDLIKNARILIQNRRGHKLPANRVEEAEESTFDARAENPNIGRWYNFRYEMCERSTRVHLLTWEIPECYTSKSLTYIAN
jgi:hypothetical protein